MGEGEHKTAADEVERGNSQDDVVKVLLRIEESDRDEYVGYEV